MRTELLFMARRLHWFSIVLLISWGHARAETFGLVARVDGQEIAAERFEHYFEDYLAERGRNIASIRDPQALHKLRGEALDALIEEELLWQEAARKGIAASPREIDAAVDGLRARFRTPEAFARRLERAGFSEDAYRVYAGRQLAVKHLVEDRVRAGITVSEREVHQFYRANPTRFAIPEQLRLRHILIAATPDAAAARAHCAAILTEARRPHADFAALARRYSQHSSATQGGDLGYVSRGQLPPPLEQAAFALKEGEVSGEVATELGCHLLKLERRRSGAVPEAEARETARALLKEEKAGQALRKHLETLRARAKIEILSSP